MNYGWWLPAVCTGQLLLLASRLAPKGLLLEIELLHLELLVVEQLLHLFLGQVARLLRLQVDVLNHEAVAVVLVDFLDLVKRILWVEDLVLVLVILFFTHVVLFLVTVAWDCQAILLFSILIVYKLILMLLDDVAVGCHVLFVIDILLSTLDVDLSDLQAWVPLHCLLVPSLWILHHSVFFFIVFAFSLDLVIFLLAQIFISSEFSAVLLTAFTHILVSVAFDDDLV